MNMSPCFATPCRKGVSRLRNFNNVHKMKKISGAFMTKPLQTPNDARGEFDDCTIDI